MFGSFLLFCFVTTLASIAEGHWPHRTESCEFPHYPDHGSYLVFTNDHSGWHPKQFVLVFECKSGYQLAGPKYISCYHGVWSEKLPECMPVKVEKCILPPHPAHGSYVVTGVPDAASGQALDNVDLNITCETGYGIAGSLQRTCKNGEWSENIPDCEATKGSCVLPPFPPNGSYAVAGVPNAAPGQAFDTVDLTFTCPHGFDIAGRKDRTCHKGIWSEEVESCKPISRLCFLPPYPGYGSYKVFGKPTAKPGQAFSALSLDITCDPGYEYPKDSNIMCVDGSWITTNTKCQTPPQMCMQQPFLDSGYRLPRNASSSSLADRIVAFSFVCLMEFNSDAEHICTERISVDNINDCVPKKTEFVNTIAKGLSSECGTISPKANVTMPFFGGITPVRKGEAPWHAGIFMRAEGTGEQICGGSIVSHKLVISAGQCFYSDRDTEQPPTLFAVAVGKLNRIWNDTSDGAQIFDVSRLIFPSRFQGETGNYQDDLALVILDKPIVFNDYVRPICLSFDPDFEDEQLTKGNLATIVGWSLDIDNDMAENGLQLTQIPYVPVEKCLDNTSKNSKKFITGDKICAGDGKRRALCKVANGDGLAFPSIRYGFRYYLRGVVSSPFSKSVRCVSDWYSTFTQLSKHERFIRQYI